MDQATLVGLEIDKGSQIVDALDRAGLDPKVALWIVTPEYEDGRLVLASPKLSQSDSLKAYKQVHDALRGTHLLHQVPPMLVLRMTDGFIRSLREIFKNASSVLGMRLGGQSIGKRFVSDAYVYRIN